MTGDIGYPPLNWHAVAACRAFARIGRLLVYRADVESTNALAASLLPGAEIGTVVVTDHQTAGRGRLSRQWIAPAGSSLTFTVVLGPMEPSWLAPMAVGLALVEAIEAFGIEATLKWPNDVLIDGYKCAGILIESKRVGAALWLLAGIGLNVRRVDPSLSQATWLDAHAREPLSREDLLTLILARLEFWIESGVVNPTQIRDDWKARLLTLGRIVEVHTAGDTLRGVAKDVGPEGTLLVKLDDGTEREVRAGDVTLASSYPGSPAS